MLAPGSPASGGDTGQAQQVPDQRFAKGTYSSPHGEFTLKCDDFLAPGIRVLESRADSATTAVQFVFGFGQVYLVFLTPDAPDSQTVAKLSQDFKLDESLRDKRIITTGRGSELRLLGVTRGGSPAVTQTKVGDTWVEKPNDLYQAWSIFRDHHAIYRVAAEITPLEAGSDSLMMERAKAKLESLLRGLVIRP